MSGILPRRVPPGIADRRRIVPYRPPPPPFDPASSIPDCLSWWDAFDAAQITLGGSGGVQVVGLGDKGPAGVSLAPDSAPTNGVPMGTWEIAGETVDLPGPIPAAVSPTRVLEGLYPTTMGDLTIFAMIPLGDVPTNAHYWVYGSNTIPVVRIALTSSVSPSGQIRLLLGSGIGPTLAIGTLALDGGNGPAAHGIVVATLNVGTGAVTLDAWYDRDLGSGIQHPTQVTGSGYVGTSLDEVQFGGRDNVSNTWSGTDGRLHTVITYGRVLTSPEIAELVQWGYARLGWEEP